MIKFFRNIRNTLITERKMGKYLQYALGEIILVMVGILLALQVSNWNGHRIQVKKESDYVAQINKEFQLNRVQFDIVADRHKRAFNSIKRIMNMMPIESNSIHLDSLSLYIRESLEYFTFNPQQSTINALTSTSSFETLSNVELRGLLQNWDEIVNDYNEEEYISRQQFYDTYFPYLKRHIFLIDLIDRKNVFERPNLDLSFIESMEFENEIAGRFVVLKDIVQPSSGESELERISQTIDKIIELSASGKQ